MNAVSHTSTDKFFIFLSAIFLLFATGAVVTSLYWLVIFPFAFLLCYLAWQCPRLCFFALVVSLPWSVEYSFSSSLGTDLPDEPLMVLTAALFISYFFFKPPQASSGWHHPLISFLFIYFGWILITVPFSTDWLISLKFALAKGWYLLAFVFAPVSIFRNKKSIQTTALIFLFSMISVATVAVCRHALFGFRFANINEAVAPFFRNHVNYSAMLVCAMPLLIACYQLSKKSRPVIVAGIIFLLMALFLSFSRGAWMALLTGAVSYWLIIKKKLLIAFLLSLVLVAASLYWISNNDRYLRYAHDFKTTIFHKNFEEHLIATYKLKDLSTAERFNRWIAGVKMVKDNPLFGVGPNNFYNNYKPYTIPAFKTWVSSNKEHSTVHNYFLLIAAEQGIPGLLFFLLVVGGMLYYSERLYSRTGDRFYKAAALACGAILTMILTVNFLSDLVETDKVGSLFFLCLAALVAIDFNTRISENQG